MPTTAFHRWPSLSQSSPLRFATLMSLYICEGVPIGLQSIAMPAWLLANGYSVESVGSFRAVASLPWSLKIFIAPLMDTCMCRTLGFRRPWVCAMQFGLICSLLALGLVSINGIVVSIVTMCAFTVNVFSASMDVAIDGMAIDILQPDERGMANALMGAGQTIGGSVLGVICGAMLPSVGLAPAAFTCACIVVPVFMLILCTLERPGERRLPHSDCVTAFGVPPPETGVTGPPLAKRAEDHASLMDKACSVVRGLALDPAAILVLLAYFAAGIAAGVGQIMWPKVGLNHGISSSYYATLESATEFCAALLSLAAGYAIDRFGPTPIFFACMVLGGLPLIAVAVLEEAATLTQSTYIACKVLSVLASQMRFVTFIAYCMTLCSSSLAAATQFAAMMAISNFSRTAGDALVAAGLLQTPASYFLMMAELLALAALLAGGLMSLRAEDIGSKDAARKGTGAVLV